MKAPTTGLLPRVTGAIFFTAYALYIIALQTREILRSPGPVPVDDVVARTFVVLMFLLMALSYVLRLPARVKAVGFRERFFPFLCAVLPIAVNESSAYFAPVFEASRVREAAASATLFLGNLISVWALLYLRRAFSIMAEVRDLVSRGPFRFVRHPIYLGQILSTAGLWLLAPSWVGLGLFGVFVLCQIKRASFEEAKLGLALPEYRTYREKTGAFFPKG